MQGEFTFTAKTSQLVAVTRASNDGHPVDSHPSVNRLPVELVVQIFTSGAWVKWYELLSLTHICRHWRDVARVTPRLWADAVSSMLKLGVRTNALSFRCLSTLLLWSKPYPLRLEMHVFGSSPAAVLPSHLTAIKPHVSRLRHLSVRVYSARDVVVVFEATRSGMPSLESLCIFGPVGILAVSFSNEQIALSESDLPRLHTLDVPGFLFTAAAALKTLQSVRLNDHPRSHEVFLAALERCALSLKELTVEDVGNERWAVEGPTRLRPALQLPNLRRLRVTIWRGSSPSPDRTGIIPGISFPPDVVIEIDRNDQGNTYALLPKDLIGLHAPPFFDALRLFVSGSEVIMNCSVGGADRLSVRETKRAPTHLYVFLRDYMSVTVTELTVHLDPDNPPPLPQLINSDCLSSFIEGCPNLHRLELLGENVRDARLRMAKAFLDHLAESESGSGPRAKCLAFALEVEERPLVSDKRRDRYMDEFRYTVDYQVAAIREQLDAIEGLLKAHLAAGGPRLPRLELCLTIVRAGADSNVGPQTVGAPYRRIADVPPSSHWARKLSWLYLPRFEAVVDEVVFLGHPQTLVGGARQLPTQPDTLIAKFEPGQREARTVGDADGSLT